jgi:murein DD-endopeptidase MepM/ murein hydrolase activator NlpD
MFYGRLNLKWFYYFYAMNSKNGLLIIISIGAFLLLIISINWFWPHRFQLPVVGMTRDSYDQKSFWYYPWGKSVTHKGVDIFAKKGTVVLPVTPGFVIYSGTNDMGGEVVLVLGPKLRTHYYAHLKARNVSTGEWLSKSDTLGWVGDSGNAKGKPPHLHYCIKSLLPIYSNKTEEIQGDLKIWYINPIPMLNKLTRK